MYRSKCNSLHPSTGHSTHTLCHQPTWLVHLLVICIAHLTCGFRHRLKLISEMSDIFPYCGKALPQCALNSRSCSSVFGRMCQCRPPLHVLLRVALYCTSFLHAQFMFDWSFAVHIIKFFPYVFVTHRG